MEKIIRKNVYITKKSDPELFNALSNVDGDVKVAKWLKERALIGHLVLTGQYRPSENNLENNVESEAESGPSQAKTENEVSLAQTLGQEQVLSALDGLSDFID